MSADSIDRLSIVVPVYNERQFLPEMLQRVQAVELNNINREIVIVDDASTDGTADFLETLSEQKNRGEVDHFTDPETGSEVRLSNLKIYFQGKNQGKGAALRRGFNEATGDVAVVQDADLEYDPEDYESLLGPIIRGEADVVYGSRFIGGPHRVLFFWHYAGNRLLTLFSNMLTNLNLTDMETCYKMFRAEVLDEIEIQQDRFGFEPEVTAKVAKGDWRIYEVPVSYYGRTYDEGKKITWVDGIKAFWCILRYNLF